MFFGAHEVKIDAKGRMAVPVRFREEILSMGNGEIIVTVDMKKDSYLLLYPRPQWDEFQAQLLDLEYDEGVRMIQRRVLGYARETTMDAQGRISISGFLRKQASLEKEALLIGQGRRFELWDEAAWSERCDSFELSAEVKGKLSSLKM